MVFEMQIIKEELQFEESLKQRLEFICEFSKVTPTFINGSIRKIDKTNKQTKISIYEKQTTCMCMCTRTSWHE